MIARYFALLVLLLSLSSQQVDGQTLERQLLAETADTLAKAALNVGDARRGAIVFHLPHMACTKCHAVDGSTNTLGPSLTKFDMPPKDSDLVDAVLRPSKSIRKGFESVSVVTADGRTLTGLSPHVKDGKLVLKDASRNGAVLTIDEDDIEQKKVNDVSIMPAGQANQLAGRQQFLDLVRYLIEIRDGGTEKAAELQPPPHLLVARPLPAYEKEIDHAGMIRDLNGDSFRRGQAIYNRLCINCHGTHDRPGSLPTSLKFASGKFKNGGDPYTMYQTLTRGFGMMIPQTWMVPQQKYDVIHYIREAYLKEHNASQLFAVNDGYLATLPKGTGRGPAPSIVEPWVNMDYGPSMVNTYEVGRDASNFAYKGIAMRVDAGGGGVSRGNAWMVFDHDTLRVAAAWTKPAEGTAPFIDWQGIHFNGRHNIHPRVSGDVQFENPTGPGWANPEDGSFDDPRLVGRDDRKYGPLPRSWAQLQGFYAYGPKTIVDYTVGNARVQEMAGVASGPDEETSLSQPLFTRTFNIGSRDRDMLLQIATHPSDTAELIRSEDYVVFSSPPNTQATPTTSSLKFDGATHAYADVGDKVDMTKADYTITAKIKTRDDGSIFTKTANTSEWVRDGKSLFVRGGRLVFDIGWVGAVQSRQRVNDGRWHDVAMTWDKKDETATLYIDGRQAAQSELAPRERVRKHVVRVGYTSANFPGDSRFEGELNDVRFYQRKLSHAELRALKDDAPTTKLVAHWPLNSKRDSLHDVSGNKLHLTAVCGAAKVRNDSTLISGYVGDAGDATWKQVGQRLCLKISAGKRPLKFVVWTGRLAKKAQATTEIEIAQATLRHTDVDLSRMTNGGPARWPDRVVTEAKIGPGNGPFAVDLLTRPKNNPWLAQVRLTGFDFHPDGDRMAICSWDGDVWLVSGLSKLDDRSGGSVQLSWQRIASGLFQPLGLKLVDGRIFVSCRDQICILNDLNGDGETDHYECFNNDHQVTDHFHEFAMGLQTDKLGNFYYAKSARHALPALVPHHGTLLKVSYDGQTTDILANGFRAANGVCLNPDGSFIVTDQEGHWNPKNRINWVTPGGFYGNMYGYHDVKDSSDKAMDQPLCWITNAFDRSPSELLWVDSEKWGPLNGSLLNLSYGYGKVYVVPHEEVNGQRQGGMCAFPIVQLPTGTMRGRFRPHDGQLYVCGMFAWGSNQQQEGGGLYRLRRTNKPVHLPVGLRATKQGVAITLSDKVDRASAERAENYQVKVWSLLRSKNYGSKHINEHTIDVTSATLADDGKTITLTIPDVAPTWCMEIKYELQTTEGRRIENVIHNTIHNLGE